MLEPMDYFDALVLRTIAHVLGMRAMPDGWTMDTPLADLGVTATDAPLIAHYLSMATGIPMDAPLIVLANPGCKPARLGAWLAVFCDTRFTMPVYFRATPA